MNRRPTLATRVAVGALALATAHGAAQAQTTFSITHESPTIAVPDSAFGDPITEGDILRATTATQFPALGPLATPSIAISGARLNLPLHAGCVGHPPGAPCGVEVDALSYGKDARVGPGRPVRWWFSVDEFAGGKNTAAPPNVFTEGARVPAFKEAAADLFIGLGIPTPQVCPQMGAFANTGAIDGDGLVNPAGVRYPGLGLIEPVAPVCNAVDAGDNLDAVDVDGPPAKEDELVYFSLDSGFVDPGCGQFHTNSAAMNSGAFAFSSADVLVATPNGAINVYAPAAALGLDFTGLSTDDIDALAIWENGVAGYQPSQQPFDWLAGNSDMVLFSVRRGSWLVGQPASNCNNAPIEPGDILMPAPGGGALPAILVSADALGLATSRVDGVPFGDDLDALDSVNKPVFDCNDNGLVDAADIANGLAPDVNMDGVPDGCGPGVVVPRVHIGPLGRFSALQNP